MKLWSMGNTLSLCSRAEFSEYLLWARDFRDDYRTFSREVWDFSSDFREHFHYRMVFLSPQDSRLGTEQHYYYTIPHLQYFMCKNWTATLTAWETDCLSSFQSSSWAGAEKLWFNLKQIKQRLPLYCTLIDTSRHICVSPRTMIYSLRY